MERNFCVVIADFDLTPIEYTTKKAHFSIKSCLLRSIKFTKVAQVNMLPVMTDIGHEAAFLVIGHASKLHFVTPSSVNGTTSTSTRGTSAYRFSIDSVTT